MRRFSGSTAVIKGIHMKSIFSLVGLLLVLAIVAVLVKRQMAVTTTARPAVAQPGNTTITAPALPATPTVSPQNQVDQVKKALDQAVQSRPMPDNQ